MWDDKRLKVSSDPGRRAKYRSLQSQWRHEVLRAEPGFMADRADPVGSLLSEDDVGTQRCLNFLTAEAYAHAKDRAAEVNEAGGTLEVTRLWRNLLSSMPLAFNFFGALRKTPAFLELVRALWVEDAKSIDDVQCEWSPRPKSEYLNDKTAFDAAIWLRDHDDRRVLLGIEVKYTDDFSPTEYDSDRYRAISDLWFERDAVEELKQRASNQMWRNAMLAASIGARGDVSRALVGTLTLAEDKAAAKSVKVLKQHLRAGHAERLRAATIEDAVKIGRDIPTLTAWADLFDQRYLSGPKQTGAPAPSGPAPLRTLPSLT